MSKNLSKIKRDNLIRKLVEIKSFLEKNSSDEESKKLQIYLDEVEKEIYGKKYGLVFEEHQERIDELLQKNTSVLNNEEDLFINNGGSMNFLIEGDNLASVQLLLKTHKEKIDLIYLDPPYNTGNKDFIYDDTYVDKEDGFRHSKWLSFMEKRLRLAGKLLKEDGVLVISIGHQEVHNLVMLCKELFVGKEVVSVTIQTSGGKPSGGFNYLQEYLIFITPKSFEPNPMQFAGGTTRSPFEGLTLSTFTKAQRPNQTYPIFIDEKTGHIVGTGLSLAKRIEKGTYTGDALDFVYNYEEAPEGTVAIWPVSSKGNDCVWRLIQSRLLEDWQKGFIKVSKNKSKVNPNKYSVQYLPSGVIKKIEENLLEVVGTETNSPTLVFGENKTVGSDIPTIWTEKDFFTTKGTNLLKGIFNEKKFPYPKPLELMCEIIRATSGPDSIILDFFAGSGTTGHATMQLNKIDNGSREFILCTNNENNICREITYERIKQVIKRDNYLESLKYFKVGFVDIEDKFYYEYAEVLTSHIKELIELENAIDLTSNEGVRILLTDEELENFLNDLNSFSHVHTVYLGYDVLMNSDQIKIFNQNNITSKVIPDYYYKELRG